LVYRREKMKDIFKRAVIGIGIAMSLFSISGIIFDIAGGGNYQLDNYGFTKMVIGCMIVGLGFGAPSVVYKFEKIPMPVCILIHMGIGSIIYNIVAFSVGWTGTGDLLQGVIAVAVQLGIAFVIWFLFMQHYRREARRMNDRIQAMK